MIASADPALKRLYATYGNRVAFDTLCAYEAHPADRFPQPQSFAEKLAHARDCEARDCTPRTVAGDNIEGFLHHVLDAKPELANLMDNAGGQCRECRVPGAVGK